MAEQGQIPAPILLYDGDCPLCHGTVRFVLRHERRRTLLFASLAGPTARRILAGRPDLAHLDTVMWVDHARDGGGARIEVRSAAALRLVSYLGGRWRLLGAVRILPRSWRDAVYDLVARHRHRLAAGRVRRPLPAHDRARFLDPE